MKVEWRQLCQFCQIVQSQRLGQIRTDVIEYPVDALQVAQFPGWLNFLDGSQDLSRKSEKKLQDKKVRLVQFYKELTCAS